MREGAAAARVGLLQVRHRQEVASRRRRLPVAHDVARNQARHGGDQRAGVVVLRAREDVLDATMLDQHAVPHHGHAVGNLGHHAEVVGDEHDGGAVPRLQLLEQLQDLRLGGDVERGGGLVGDDQRRLERQRHGDHHPLALAAGQLVRVAGKDALGLGQAHVAEHLDDALAALAGAQPGVHLDDLVGLAADGHQRVERHHRLLEDHGDAAAAHAADGVGRQRQQILPLVDHAAAGDAHMRLGQQAQDRLGHHRLAGAGFADDAQDLLAHDLQRDAVDGVAAGRPRTAGRRSGSRC